MKLRAILLFMLLAALAGPAQADTWRVDLILFRFLGGVDEVGRLPQAPGTQGAIELDDTARLSAAGITVLPESEFGLEDQWRRIKASPQFRPVLKLAWTQNDPPPQNGPRLRVHGGNAIRLPAEQGLGERQFEEIDGSLALHLGRFLHLEADLVYTTAGEEPSAWRLAESRRMRSDELHHLDSPKLGILVRVTKAGPGLTDRAPLPGP